MARKAAKAKSRVKAKKARKAMVASKKKAAGKKAAKKVALRKKIAPKKPPAAKKKTAKKAPVPKAGGDVQPAATATLALRPTKDQAVVDCVITVLNSNNPGWNADGRGEGRTLADLRVPAGLFLSQVNRCLRPKGFMIVVTNALTEALATGTIAAIEIAVQDATHPSQAGGARALVAALALKPLSKDQAVVDCVSTVLNANNPGWNADLKGEGRTLADLQFPSGLFLTQVNKCLKTKGFKVVVTNALKEALETGTIADIEIALQDAVKPL
jgi:hypothetical protein